MKATLVIHRVTKSPSGEGFVVRVSAELLREKNLDVTLAPFSPPTDDLGFKNVRVFPIHLRRFDKYQRLLTMYSARKTRPDFFLNMMGVPIPLSDIAPHVVYGVAPEFSSVPSKYSSSLFWKLYLMPMKAVIGKLKSEAKRCVYLANSKYSAKAIKEVYDVEATVIYPPVDVQDFLKAFHETGEPFFVTVGRFEEGKRLDLALEFSARSGIRGVVIGAMEGKSYLKYLQKRKEELKANVVFLPNASRAQLLETMSRASLYFHPTPGEHFGIPIVEAMASGLIPLVPEDSGGAEIVPEFKYRSIQDAVELAKGWVEAPPSVRRELRDRSTMFSRENYKEKMLNILEKFS